MGVSGPMTGGSKGWAFGGPAANLVVLGYVVRDGDGIARRGIRLPQVEAPLAHNSAIQQSGRRLLPAGRLPLPVEKVRGLDGDRATYLQRDAEATRAAVAAAVILPRDVDPLLAEAVAAVPL